MRLGARPTAAMPEGYVRALFDGYAPAFDKALTEGLGYSAPELLFGAVQAAHAGARMKFGSVLDLGCGTGLAALPFRPFSDWMVGVDLSAAMLAQARGKGLYDRLIEAEVQHFLTEEAKIGARYHLVLAADVFMYFDDLGPVLKAAAQVLAPVGQLAFSVETHDGDGVLLRETLRYAHGEAHVQRGGGSSRPETGQSRFRLDPHGKRRSRSRADRVGNTLKRWNPRAISSTLRTRCRTSLRAGSQAAAGSRARISSTCWRKRRAGRSTLLIAPTGGGKTLAGFLPTLVELSERDVRPRNLKSTGRALVRSQGLHTLYISPLKALAVDIARNLEIPVHEMGLPIRLETRTGDTPTSKRQRQRRDPPDILLTTPEQLALLLASADAPYLFGTLRRVVLDELHSLVTSKRGDLLSLGLARLFALAPQLTTVGLSATVAEPDDLRRFLVPQPPQGEARADLVIAQAGAQPNVAMLDTEEHLPWAGHSARHALGEIYGLIKTHKTTLIFVNTRSQAEISVPGAVAHERRQPRHRAASRLARRRATPQGRGRDGERQAARRGVHVLARSRRRLGRRRSRDQCRRAEGLLRGCCSGSAAPTTGSTSRPKPCWCRPTASRCWNAAPRSTRLPRMRRTRRRCAPARSTCWRSTFSAAPCGAPFLRRRALRGGDARPRPMPRSRARISTPRSISSRPAAMR